MDKEYVEIKLSLTHLVIGIILSVISGILLISCLMESPGEYKSLIVICGLVLIYGVYSCLEQINGYIRYDNKGFEVRNAIGKVRNHTFDEVKAIRVLKKKAVIVYMNNSRRQYEIETRPEMAEGFLEAFNSYRTSVNKADE